MTLCNTDVGFSGGHSYIVGLRLKLPRVSTVPVSGVGEQLPDQQFVCVRLYTSLILDYCIIHVAGRGMVGSSHRVYVEINRHFIHMLVLVLCIVFLCVVS